MTEKDIFNLVWKKSPFMFRNNRGMAKTKNGFIRFGIPEPKGHETDDDLKGGDLIGFEIVRVTPEMVGKNIAVFKSVEVKTKNDRLKKGQIKWHNLIIGYGGISEIWKENKIISEVINE